MGEPLRERDHPSVDPAHLLGGNAEDAADDLERQRACEVADEVHLAMLDGRVDEGVRGRLDRFAVAVDRARCEAAAEGAAHHLVAFAVERDQPAGEHSEQLEPGRADECGQELRLWRIWRALASRQPIWVEPRRTVCGSARPAGENRPSTSDWSPAGPASAAATLLIALKRLRRWLRRSSSR